MARYGCLMVAVIVALALLFFIVFLWSGWLNRPAGNGVVEAAARRDVTELRLADPVVTIG